MTEASAPTAPATPETPASSPAPTTPDLPGRDTTVENDVPQTTDNDFLALGNDFDDDTLEVELPEGETGAEPDEPKAPVEPTAAQPKPAEAKPAEPKSPVQPAQPTAPQAEVAPSSPSADPQEFVQQLLQHRDGVLDELAKTKFAFTPEEAKKLTDDLDIDATKTLIENVPKLKAQVFYEAVTATLQHMQRIVPQMIFSTMKQVEAHKAAEQQFFKQFPQLSREKHWNDIVSFANAFKQANKGLSQADLMSMVGAAVMGKLGLNGGAPGRQVQPNRSPTPPFVPAQNGAGGSVRVTREDDSPYAGLGMDFEDQ